MRNEIRLLNGIGFVLGVVFILLAINAFTHTTFNPDREKMLQKIEDINDVKTLKGVSRFEIGSLIKCALNARGIAKISIALLGCAVVIMGVTYIKLSNTKDEL